IGNGIAPSAWPERPTCDRLQAVAYTQAIERVELDARKRFTLSSDGQSRWLFGLVTHDFSPHAETVCD
ncbi:MAG: hypothetical protein ACPHCN_18430, partial [Mycobacterium sp.]